MDVPMEMDKEGSSVVPQRKYYIDNTFIHVPREGVEIASPMKDGMSTSHDIGPGWMGEIGFSVHPRDEITHFAVGCISHTSPVLRCLYLPHLTCA